MSSHAGVSHLVLVDRVGAKRLEGTVCHVRDEFGFIRHPDFDSDVFFHFQCMCRGRAAVDQGGGAGGFSGSRAFTAAQRTPHDAAFITHDAA